MESHLGTITEAGKKTPQRPSFKSKKNNKQSYSKRGAAFQLGANRRLLVKLNEEKQLINEIASIGSSRVEDMTLLHEEKTTNSSSPSTNLISECGFRESWRSGREEEILRALRSGILRDRSNQSEDAFLTLKNHLRTVLTALVNKAFKTSKIPPPTIPAVSFYKAARGARTSAVLKIETRRNIFVLANSVRIDNLLHTFDKKSPFEILVVYVQEARMNLSSQLTELCRDARCGSMPTTPLVPQMGLTTNRQLLSMYLSKKQTFAEKVAPSSSDIVFLDYLTAQKEAEEEGKREKLGSKGLMRWAVRRIQSSFRKYQVRKKEQLAAIVLRKRKKYHAACLIQISFRKRMKRYSVNEYTKEIYRTNFAAKRLQRFYKARLWKSQTRKTTCYKDPSFINRTTDTFKAREKEKELRVKRKKAAKRMGISEDDLPPSADVSFSGMKGLEGGSFIKKKERKNSVIKPLLIRKISKLERLAGITSENVGEFEDAVVLSDYSVTRKNMATKIQAYAHGVLVRRQNKKRHKAASRIQCLYRARLAAEMMHSTVQTARITLRRKQRTRWDAIRKREQSNMNVRNEVVLGFEKLGLVKEKLNEAVKLEQQSFADVWEEYRAGIYHACRKSPLSKCWVPQLEGISGKHFYFNINTGKYLKMHPNFEIAKSILKKEKIRAEGAYNHRISALRDYESKVEQEYLLYQCEREQGNRCELLKNLQITY